MWAALGSLTCLLSPAASAGLTCASQKAGFSETGVAASQDQFFSLLKTMFPIPILCIHQSSVPAVPLPTGLRNLLVLNTFPGEGTSALQSALLSFPLFFSLIRHVNK